MRSYFALAGAYEGHSQWKERPDLAKFAASSSSVGVLHGKLLSAGAPQQRWPTQITFQMLESLMNVRRGSSVRRRVRALIHDMKRP